MKCLLGKAVAASLGMFAALLAISPGASGQGSLKGTQKGNIFIPQSSIERPEDIGKRAHTNFRIRTGPSNLGSGIHPMGGNGPAGGMSPAQLRKVYLLPSKGGSQIIGIVDAFDYPAALADFNAFATQFGLPTEASTTVTANTNKVFQVVYAGGSEPPSDAGWNVEEALDIEWAHAMAPNAKIVLFEGNSNSFADLYQAEAAATSFVDAGGLSCKEVSNSWGSSEYDGETDSDSAFSSPTIVYFASAGDNGAPAGYPSSSPYVVSAGGTGVITDSNGNFVSEYGWSGTGGGPSQYETTPFYQNGISNLVSGARGTPDLSFEADPNTGVSVYNAAQGGWIVVGGTSVSSPSLAGIANLAGTAQGFFPAGSQVLLTSIYNNYGSVNFRDIVTGNDGYPAGPGWDFVTGVGSVQGLGGLSTLIVSNVTPPTATAGGASFTITINGYGFTSTSTVDWNGAALPTTYVSTTQLTAQVSDTEIINPGTYTVSVDNGGGDISNTVPFVVSSGALAITSLSPASATAGSPGFAMAVNGQNFTSGSVVYWNGTPLTTVYVSYSLLLATVPASAIAASGSYGVTVDNPDSTVSNTVNFTVSAAPVITGLSPASVAAGGPNFTLFVNGVNFVPGSTVNWNGTSLTTTFVSATEVTAPVPASDILTAGTVPVTVSNPGGVKSSSYTFTIATNPPTITALLPSSAVAGSPALILTISGTGFASPAKVLWNSIPLTATVVSTTKITVPIPAAYLATPGSANVVVQESGEFTENSNAAVFTISSGSTPTVTSINPSTVTAGSPAFTLTVTGTGFAVGSTINWNGGALNTAYTSPTQVSATVPAVDIANTGTASISVSNSGSKTSNSVTLTISSSNGTLTISTLSPSSVTAGSPAFTMTIYGSGYVAKSVAQWNNSPMPTTVVSPTELTLTIPASFVAKPGSDTFTVLNPGNALSNSAAFTVTSSPVITSLSPNSVTAGSPSFLLTVTGAGFVAGSTVNWNKGTLLTTYVNPTTLTASVPPSDVANVGTALVTVINPGSIVSNGAQFTITSSSGPPTITSLSPATLPAGSPGFTLTVNGSGFVTGSVVNWNGTALPTTFISSTQLTAAVPASDVANIGTAKVTVTNPGNIMSNSSNFVITVPPPVITTLSPNTAPAGGPSFTMTITGSGFTGGSYVYWNGAPLATTYVSGTTLKVTVPASYIAVAGTAQVIVVNPGDVASDPATFVITSGTIGSGHE